MRVICDCRGKCDSPYCTSLLSMISLHKADMEKVVREASIMDMQRFDKWRDVNVYK